MVSPHHFNCLFSLFIFVTVVLHSTSMPAAYASWEKLYFCPHAQKFSFHTFSVHLILACLWVLTTSLLPLPPYSCTYRVFITLYVWKSFLHLGLKPSLYLPGLWNAVQNCLPNLLSYQKPQSLSIFNFLLLHTKFITIFCNFLLLSYKTLHCLQICLPTSKSPSVFF